MNFIELDEIEKRDLVPGGKVRFVHSDSMTLAYWTFEADGQFPEHAHPHEQVSSMIDGEFELTVDGKTRILNPGNVVIIPPNAAHSGKAVTKCRIIDVFHPVREDYR
ncbi:MAG: cupin domain-containing protein [Desulfobacterales bacterium]|nr:cupin domain-containing protein [Desulfobacterales bacterium]